MRTKSNPSWIRRTKIQCLHRDTEKHPKSAKFRGLNPLSRETLGGMDGARCCWALQGFPGFPGSPCLATGEGKQGWIRGCQRATVGDWSRAGWKGLALEQPPHSSPWRTTSLVDFSHLIKEENSPGSQLTFPGSRSRPANSGSVFGLSLFWGPGSAGKSCLTKPPREISLKSLIVRVNAPIKSPSLSLWFSRGKTFLLRSVWKCSAWAGECPLCGHGAWGRFGISGSVPAKSWILGDNPQPGMCPELSGHGKMVDKAMEKWWTRPRKNHGQGRGKMMDKAMEK